MSVEIRFSARGERDAVARAVSWIQHHPQRQTAFHDELAGAFDLLRLFPEAGRRAQLAGFKGARVLVLRETEHLVIYRVRKAGFVEISAIVPAKKAQRRP